MSEEKIMVEGREGGQRRKLLVYGLVAFAVIAATVLLVFMFIRHEDFSAIKDRIFKAIAPCFIGAVMAYLMNPLMIFIEERLKWLFYKRSRKISRANRAARIISIVITLILVFVFIAYLLNLLIPQLVATVTGIVENFPDQAERVKEWYWGLELEKTQVGEYLEMGFVKVTDYLEDFFNNKLMSTTANVLGSLASGIWSLIGTIYNILIGLIFSIYILGYKEKLSAISKKIVFSVFKRRSANKIIRITKACHIKFTASITGKVVDSVIIGLLCFVAMKLLDIPYPALISVIVGVTNVIPFFGPFIGAIPSAILVLFASPIKCLWFIILIIVLQQLDANVITPKIVGDSIGLSPFWVLFACTFFGSLWGIVGMLIGAPLMACIYMIAKEHVEDSLHKRGLMTETGDYMDIDRVEETEKPTAVVAEAPNAPEPVKEESKAEPEAVPAPGEEAAPHPASKKGRNSKNSAGSRQKNRADYVPATIRELNRAAGKQKYTIDSDFLSDAEEAGPEPDPETGSEKEAAANAENRSFVKTASEYLKGLIHRK